MATPWHTHWIDKAAGRVFRRPMMFSDGWGSIEAIEALLVAWIRSEADLVIADPRRDKHPDHPGGLVLERHHPVRVAVDAEVLLDLGVAAPARVAGGSHALVLGRAA